MTDRAKSKPAAEPSPEPQSGVDRAIGQQVLRTLGAPPELHRVQVRQLWNATFRVNVFIGEAATMKIAHSYFLSTDHQGNILASSPSIVKTY
jgi:hypothetical protein